MEICSICECITFDAEYCDECDALHCDNCFTVIADEAHYVPSLVVE